MMGGKTKGTTGQPCTTKKIEEQGDRDWMRRARCKDEDPNFFFIDRGDFEQAEAIRELCGGCQVKADCLEYAIANNIRHGWWGGESERNRYRIKRARRAEQGEEWEEGEGIVRSMETLLKKLAG